MLLDRVGSWQMQRFQSSQQWKELLAVFAGDLLKSRRNRPFFDVDVLPVISSKWRAASVNIFRSSASRERTTPRETREFW